MLRAGVPRGRRALPVPVPPRGRFCPRPPRSAPVLLFHLMSSGLGRARGRAALGCCLAGGRRPVPAGPCPRCPVPPLSPLPPGPSAAAANGRLAPDAVTRGSCWGCGGDRGGGGDIGYRLPLEPVPGERPGPVAPALCPAGRALGDPPWVTGTRGGGAQPAASVGAMAEPLAAPLLPVPLPARVCGGDTARVATRTSGTPAHLVLGRCSAACGGQWGCPGV